MATSDASLTRRGFIGMAAFAAGTAGLMAAGCSSSQGDSSKSKSKTEEISRTEEFDVVVIGSGTAGTAATLKAAELGGKVVCLEQNATMGGSSVMTRGLCGINTRFQAAQGLEYDKDEILKETLQYHHYSASGNLVRLFVDECGATVDWYEENGISFAYAIGLGASRPVWHIPLGDDGKPAGTSYMLGVLQEAAQEKGAEFRTDTQMTSLIVEDGAVKGVLAKEGDQTVAYRGNAVILATGGYSDSAEAFSRFTDFDFDGSKAWGVPGRNGDGILFAVDQANAATHHAGTVMFHVGTLEHAEKFNSDINFATLWQPLVHVNERAVRYFDESQVNDFSACGNAMAIQTGNYVIFDDAYIKRMESEGPVYAAAALGIPAGEPYACRGIIESSEDVVKADTIEELAEALGLDGATLSKTISDYNAMAEAGKDTLFGRTDGLYPVSTAPFYGAKALPTYFTTVGGLKVNEQFEVLDKDGSVIEGLYAAGCDAGGLYGADYDVSVASGSQQGWCATSGRIAAQNALSA